MTASPPPLDQMVVPAEIRGWNWGGFLLNWIWGVGNNTFVALLTFVPFVWAWRNSRWDSIAHFKWVQRLWAIWGA